MKKRITLIFALFITSTIFCQNAGIKITNQASKKEILIKENKRIKIKTMDGEKISGRFKIENNSILIKGKQINITDIAHIKRDPLFVSIVSSGLLIYGGSIGLGTAAIVGIFLQRSAFLLALPAAGMIYTGIKSPNFNRKFKNNGKWTLDIISLSK